MNISDINKNYIQQKKFFVNLEIELMVIQHILELWIK